MGKVSVTCFAFLITLDVLLTLTRARDFYNDKHETYTRNLNKGVEVSPPRERFLGVHIHSQQPALKKWTFSSEDRSKVQRQIHNQATFSPDYRGFQIIQENFKRPNQRTGSSPMGKYRVGFVDRKPRPRKSLHHKEIEHFTKVLRKRIKVKPRQDIEFLENNQGTGVKQDDFESPGYQEVTATDNSENEDQNGFSNNYVTVIDNIDGKDTDSYSTLSSDEAKNEYTNVENSISEGANEESQLLGKEVNDVLGALTRSDSRISKIADAKLPQAQGGLPFKQTPSPYNDKGDDVDVVDEGRKDGKYNDQNGPPGDITVIEDNEEIGPNEDTRPILSKPIWDAIQIAEKNFSHQQQIVQSTADTESGRPENKTRAPTYLHLLERLPGNKNVSRPGHTLSDLESTLKIFAGTNTQSDYHNTTMEPEHTNSKSNGKKLFLTGSAEEGPEGESIESNQPSIQSSSPAHLDHLQSGNVSNAKWYSNSQSGVITSETTSTSSFSHNSPNNKSVFETYHGNGNDMNLKPWKIDTATSKDNQNDEGDQNIVPFQPGGMAVNSNSGQPGSVELERPSNDFVDGEVAPSGPEVEGDDQSNMSSLRPDVSNFPTQRVPQGATVTQDDATIVYTSPVSLQSSGKVSDRNKTLLFQEGSASQGAPHVESEYSSGSQSNGWLGQEKSANQFSGFQLKQSSSMFPGEMNANDASLVQIENFAAQNYNPKIRMRYDNSRPDHAKPAYIVSQVNEQNQEHVKGVNYVSQLGIPLQRVKAGNSSLDSWSEEYQSLIGKLRDLYGQAHGSSSPGQSAAYRNKPAYNDTQQMMKEVSRFHLLLNGRDNNLKGIGGKGMFLKDLKGDVKQEIWANTGRMNTGFLPNEDHENERGITRGKITAARFGHSTDELGQVRSILLGNLTAFRASNLSNFQKEKPNMDDNDNKPLGDDNKNVTFENRRLASRLRSSDSVQLGDTSNSSSSNLGGPSSHQVLMSYFGNETNLRKRLHSNDNDSQSELQDAGTFLKGEAFQLDNKTNTATEANLIETTLFNSIHLAPANANQTNSGLPKQRENVSNGEREESVTKYLEDFISMVNSGTASPSEVLKEIIVNSSRGESSTRVPETPPDKVVASDAAKKGNVTTLKDRVIIVVSPKSIRDLMRNRGGNSSQPFVHKGIPIMVGKVKNSTTKHNSRPNKTVTSFQAHFNNSSTNGTNHDQVQEQDSIKIANGSSNKENVTSKSENDLNMIYRDELKSLEISLSRDFMSGWIYYQRTLDEIGITPDMLRSGIANLGSPQRLKSVFKKALAGADLNVLVVGGSISAGGGLEKDRGNVEGVYHKAFSDWWNNSVTPITTSELKINTVAIGGTDSEYFSYCIKNYMRTLPDIVIWELAANDYKRYQERDFAPAKPLEQLIRIILGLRSNPALILANFFRGNYYKTAVGQDCPDSEDEGGESIAQYYKLTSLSWRNVICSQEDGKDLELKKLFSSDGYHPSLLGHAQMSALLISYFKGVFEQTISQEMMILRNRTLQKEEDDILPSLAKPMFDDPVTPKPLCWTLLTPDYGQKLRNTLPDLEFTEAAGFQFANISHWPIRRDRLRCLKATQTGAMLKMRFIVPYSENNDDNRGSSKRELAVTTHNSFGGMGTLWVDGDQKAARIIKEQTGQRRTQVDVLTRELTPGVHTVTVYALQPGFCLSAVAVL